VRHGTACERSNGPIVFSLKAESRGFVVSLFDLVSISVRPGRSAAFILPVLAAVSFGADSHAQTADVFFDRAPLSVSRDSLILPGPPPSFDSYTANTRLQPLSVAPKLDFGISGQWKEYPSLYRDNEDMAGRIPLNGGSFGIEAEPKLDLKKVGPKSEYVEGNIEKNAKKPFVGFSIVAPYNSE
jgi:hypothetical protein